MPHIPSPIHLLPAQTLAFELQVLVRSLFRFQLLLAFVFVFVPLLLPLGVFLLLRLLMLLLVFLLLALFLLPAQLLTINLTLAQDPPLPENNQIAHWRNPTPPSRGTPDGLGAGSDFSFRVKQICHLSLSSVPLGAKKRHLSLF